MCALNTNSLEMVRQELTEQCRLVAKSCEEIKQGAGQQGLLTLASQLASLRGACQILEIEGILPLLRELEQLLAEQGEQLLENTEFIASLPHLMQMIKGYLGFVYKLEYDHPLLLLLEINQIRALTGKPLLSEAYFLADCLPDANIVEYSNEKSADILLVVRRARHLFQQGLVHAIRGSGHTGAFRIMSHAVRRVHQTLGDETEQLYWLLVFQVIEAFAKRALTADKMRLRSLMAIERQLRQLVQGNSTVEQCYPVELQRTMMGYLVLANIQTPPVHKLFTQLGLTPFKLDDQRIKADRALLGSDGEESFVDTIALLRDKIDDITGLIQLFEEQRLDSEACAALLQEVVAINELCSISGLATAAKMFAECAQQLQSAGDQPPHELVTQIIDAIFYLECLLLELQGRAPTSQQLADINSKPYAEVIESNIARRAEVQVIDEAKERLREVMGRLTDMQEGLAALAVNDNVHEVFDSIAGAARMLGLEKASAVAKQCSQYARNGQLLVDLQNAKAMATFADVLVSLEYYLDNCRWDRNFDAAVLDIAEECLEQLL